MNKLERALIRTRKTIQQACKEVDVDIDDAEIFEIEQCSSCSIWVKFEHLKEDLDMNPICQNCYDTYGP